MLAGSGRRGSARTTLQAPVGRHRLNEVREVGDEELGCVPLFGRDISGLGTRLFEPGLDLAAVVRRAREGMPRRGRSWCPR